MPHRVRHAHLLGLGATTRILARRMSAVTIAARLVRRPAASRWARQAAAQARARTPPGAAVGGGHKRKGHDADASPAPPSDDDDDTRAIRRRGPPMEGRGGLARRRRMRGGRAPLSLFDEFGPGAVGPSLFDRNSDLMPMGMLSPLRDFNNMLKMLDEVAPSAIAGVPDAASHFGGWGRTDVLQADGGDNPGDYTVRIELPGCHKENTKVTIKDNVLRVRANREDEEVGEPTQDEEGGAVYSSRSTFRASFDRSWTLPDEYDSVRGIKPKIDHGVLTVQVPVVQKEAAAEHGDGEEEVPWHEETN